MLTRIFTDKKKGWVGGKFLYVGQAQWARTCRSQKNNKVSPPGLMTKELALLVNQDRTTGGCYLLITTPYPVQNIIMKVYILNRKIIYYRILGRPVSWWCKIILCVHKLYFAVVAAGCVRGSSRADLIKLNSLEFPY